ncbi:MAG: potassium/proton antiporter [Elusimicrobiota bacterium]|jgi:cell volume regulation protein A|nr:potassium/proton antiporter [Elusimicrobiota bacterium]
MISIGAFEYILLSISILLIISILASKLSNKATIPIPLLLIFLAVGMLAGSEGIGKINFDNIKLAQSIGVIALTFILFSGGLDTDYSNIKKVFGTGIVLSTLGVILTTLVVAIAASQILKLPFKESLLLGSIVSSTDAAAVFSILRSKKISLKGNLKSLLELESGSNDPMAVLLTLTSIRILAYPEFSFISILVMFLKNIIIGILSGIIFGKIIHYSFNMLKLEYEGIYSVFSIACVIFVYTITTMVDGNGFLAVYVVGVSLASRNFFYKKSLISFNDSVSWLMQIVMFISLGLLVYPSKLIQMFFPAIIITSILLFVARPIAIFICLIFSKMKLNEKLMISWVGLRGAAPIVLATFPLISGIEKADIFFNIVFFAVLISVLVQGSSIPYMAKILNVHAPFRKKSKYPIEFEQQDKFDAELLEFIVPFNGKIVGKAISELELPNDSLAMLVGRGENYIIVKGNTLLKEGDVILFLAKKADIPIIQKILSDIKTEKEEIEKSE